MRRTMIPMLATALVLGAALMAPANADASQLVSNAYQNLNSSISSAWASGQLTRGEKADVRAMQAETDRMIRNAQRSGRINGIERDRIRAQASATVSTFRRYRDNGSVRFATHHPRVHRIHRHKAHPRHVKIVIR